MKIEIGSVVGGYENNDEVCLHIVSNLEEETGLVAISVVAFDPLSEKFHEAKRVLSEAMSESREEFPVWPTPPTT